MRYDLRPLVASERAVLEVAPGTRLDLIVRAELGAPDDGRDLVQSVDVERGVANPVPPVDQRDVLCTGSWGSPVCSRTAPEAPE